MRAIGEVLCFCLEPNETLTEITDVIVRPIEVPICARVLKTAPAKPWVVVGKTSETMRIPTVNRISTDKGESSYQRN